MAFIPAGDLWFEAVVAQPPPDGEDAAIVDRLTRMVDETPPGEHIHATIFRLTLEPVRDALLAARRRGVEVRVVHNGRDLTSEVAASLSREEPHGLGAGHRWSGAAYDPTGRTADYGAVATGRNADLHTKLFLFSATRDPEGVLRRDVSWWGSANLSTRSGLQRTNNAIVVYGDPVLHEAFRTRLWDLMWTGTHFPGNDFYSAARGRGTFLGGPASRTKVFCSPEQQTDLWVGRLGSVVADGDAVVDVVHTRFTDSRLAVAELLVAMQHAGARVRVVVGADPGFLGPAVRRVLVEAGVPLRTAPVHDKLVLVHARHALSRRPRKVVLSGSHNLNHDANWVNDEILVKTFHDGLYDVLHQHVEHIWSVATDVSDPTDPPNSPDATDATDAPDLADAAEPPDPVPAP